jgi:hypothetical protein
VAIAPEWVRLKLDVAAFDASAFREVVTRCQEEGIVLRTMEDLGDHDANHQLLYELNRACSADIPERGDFYSYEEYLDERIRRAYTPATTVIALDGDRWVGMSPELPQNNSGARDARGVRTQENALTSKRVCPVRGRDAWRGRSRQRGGARSLGTEVAPV